MASITFDLGNGPIMSILMSCPGHSRISNGWSSPAFLWCCTLFCWHLTHPWIYFFTSSLSPGHQYVLLIRSCILCCPGCPMFAGSWCSLRISSLISLLLGMYILPSIYATSSSSHADPSFFCNVCNTSFSLVPFFLILLIISVSSTTFLLSNTRILPTIFLDYISSFSSWMSLLSSFVLTWSFLDRISAFVFVFPGICHRMKS